MQTKEQVMEVINSWKYPAGFITEGAVGNTNGVLLVQCVQSDFGGVFTHANLDAAVAKLGDKLAYNVRVVERAPVQTQATVDTIYREWVGKYAPKDLKQTPENAAILSAYVKTYFAGAYSITSLTEAANNAEGLQRVSAADAREAREHKERERMERDRVDILTRGNQKERNFSAEVEVKAAVDKKAKAQAGAKAEIDKIISSYIANRVNGPGQDYSLTDHRQKEMRVIESQHKDAVAALKAVREKLFSYPG